MTNNKWAQPQEVDDLTMAFPAGEAMKKLLPPLGDMPKPSPIWKMPTPDGGFRLSPMLIGGMIFGGKLKGVIPKEGIDGETAYRHLYTILNSFEPTHQHKVQAVGWLCSLWFDELIWKEADEMAGDGS